MPFFRGARAPAPPPAPSAPDPAPPSAPRITTALQRRLSPEGAGVVLMLGAIFLFSIMDATAAHLVRTEPPMMVVWARYASQTFWSFLLFAPRLGVLLRTDRPGLQGLRSVLLFGATFCFFLALKFLPLAEALAIFEVAPLFTTMLAVLVLGEHVGPRRVLGVCAGFVGALIIIRPGGEAFSWAALLPMAAAFCFASYAIATRFLGQGEHALTSFLYTSLFGAVAVTLAVPFFWATPEWPNAGLMAVFGIVGGAGQYLMILALGCAPASLLAPVGYVALIFASFWGYTLFGQAPGMHTALGALVIVSAGLYVWWRERRRAG